MMKIFLVILEATSGVLLTVILMISELFFSGPNHSRVFDFFDGLIVSILLPVLIYTAKAFGLLKSQKEKFKLILSSLERLENKLKSNTELFFYKNLDETYDSMSYVSNKADEIHTMYFSEDPVSIEGTKSGKMGMYFSQIHRYIKKNKEVSFKRIISVSKIDDVKSLFDLLLEMKGVSNLSIKLADFGQNNNIIEHTHLVRRLDNYYTFHLTSFVESGTQTYMIKDKRVYDIAKNNYLIAWEKATYLFENGIVHFDACIKLTEDFKGKSLYESLKNHKLFEDSSS